MSDDAPLDRRTFLRTAARKSVTASGGFALGLLVDAVWARALRGPGLEREEYPRILIGPYRVHHNIVGYLLLVVGLFRYPAFLVPMGVGMIVGHRIRDRLLWFIERVE